MAFDAALTAAPTSTPTANVPASTPISACSCTPATGISVKASTSTVVNGLARSRPR